MQKTHWLAALLFTSVALFLLFDLPPEVSVELPPGIKIVVGKDEYTIGANSGSDLISLVRNEFEKKSFESDPGISLSVGSSIEYQRTVDTILLLKQNGYLKVSVEGGD